MDHEPTDDELADSIVVGRLGLENIRFGGYVLERELDHRPSAGAWVYSAKHEGNREDRVALKIFQGALPLEAEIHAKLDGLRHKHILRFRGSWGTEHSPSLTGLGDLSAFAVELATTSLSSQEDVSPQDLLAIAEGIGSALEAIHAKGYVHRDISPANILRVRDQWVLGDFGLANEKDEVVDRPRVGTPSYIPPDSLTDPEGRDVWQLAKTVDDLLSDLPSQPEESDQVRRLRRLAREVWAEPGSVLSATDWLARLSPLLRQSSPRRKLVRAGIVLVLFVGGVVVARQLLFRPNHPDISVRVSRATSESRGISAASRAGALTARFGDRLVMNVQVQNSSRAGELSGAIVRNRLPEGLIAERDWNKRVLDTAIPALAEDAATSFSGWVKVTAKPGTTIRNETCLITATKEQICRSTFVRVVGVAALESSLLVGNVRTGQDYRERTVTKVDDVVKLSFGYGNYERTAADITNGTYESTAPDITDLALRIEVPDDPGLRQFPKAYAWSSDGTSVASAAVELSVPEAYLEYIPKSTKWRHNIGTAKEPKWITETLPEPAVNQRIQLGDVKPGEGFEATVTALFRVRAAGVAVSMSSTIPSTIKYPVTDIWAQDGDTVKFSYRVWNFSNSSLKDLRVEFVLPRGLKFVRGSLRANKDPADYDRSDAGRNPGTFTSNVVRPTFQGVGVTELAVGKVITGTFEVRVQPGTQSPMRAEVFAKAQGTRRVMNVVTVNRNAQ